MDNYVGFDEERQKELIREELKRQIEEESKPKAHHLRNEALTLVGGGVGSGLGLLSINPYEEIKRGVQIKRHNKFVDTLENEVNAFKALKEIRDGVSTFEDYGNAAPVLRHMYEINQDLLKNDDNLNDMINTPIPARIERIEDRRIPDIDPSRVKELKEHKRHLRMEQLKRLQPGRGVLNDFSGHLKHPAVAIGGLAGIFGSYHLLDQLDSKNNTNR